MSQNTGVGQQLAFTSLTLRISPHTQEGVSFVELPEYVLSFATPHVSAIEDFLNYVETYFTPRLEMTFSPEVADPILTNMFLNRDDPMIPRVTVVARLSSGPGEGVEKEASLFRFSGEVALHKCAERVIGKGTTDERGLRERFQAVADKGITAELTEYASFPYLLKTVFSEEHYKTLSSGLTDFFYSEAYYYLVQPLKDHLTLLCEEQDPLAWRTFLDDARYRGSSFVEMVAHGIVETWSAIVIALIFGEEKCAEELIKFLSLYSMSGNWPLGAVYCSDGCIIPLVVVKG